MSFTFQAQAFTPPEQLKSQPWAKPEQLAVVVKETQRRIKTHLAPLQRSMQLYLANKETEFILFRPIRVSYININILCQDIVI